MKTQILLALVFGLCLNTFGQTHSKTKIYYPSAQYHLNKTDKVSLQKMVDSLPLDSNYQIVIRAYTDSIGNPESNKLLSQQRANGIYNYLKSKKVLEENVKLEYYGEGRNFRDPRFLKPELDRHALVQVIIPKKEEAWESYNGPRLSNFYKNSKTKENEFLINTDSDTIIRCSGGTVIKINKNTFGLKGKSLEKEIIVFRVREILSKSEMILENLSTHSDDKFLESAGMVHLSATLNGIEVDVQPGKPISILMPSKVNPKDFKLFDGQRNPHDSSMNWRNPNSNLFAQPMDGLFNCLALNLSAQGPNSCPFFFCKIKRFFRNLRPKPSAIRPLVRSQRPEGNPCGYLNNLLLEQGIDISGGIKNEILKPLYEKYGVGDIYSLVRAMENEKLKEIELKIKDQSVNWEDYQYYVFTREKLGWINCDAFVDFRENQLTNLNIRTKPGESTDVKLVFKNRNSIMRSNATIQGYDFNRIPKNKKVWVVAIKEEKGEMFLFLEEINTSAKTVNVNWVKLNLEELQTKLKILDS